MLRPTLLLIALAVPNILFAQSIETGFLDRTVSLGGDDYNYQVYVPRDYRVTTDWPVILFLHGAGERGNDGLKPTHVGLGRAIRFNPERWPAIAVFPQVPVGESWQGIAGEVAMAALDAAIVEFSTDQSRLYLTGPSLSLGTPAADCFATLAKTNYAVIARSEATKQPSRSLAIARDACGGLLRCARKDEICRHCEERSDEATFKTAR